MGSIIEFDTSYVNTTAGKYKVTCLVSLFALFFPRWSVLFFQLYFVQQVLDTVYIFENIWFLFTFLVKYIFFSLRFSLFFFSRNRFLSSIRNGLNQVLGAIGLLAASITKTGHAQYVSWATFAFLVTLILLLILICKASLRQSSLWLKVEVVVCVILTICYIIALISIFQTCWYYLFDRFDLVPFIGSLIATVRINIVLFFSTYFVFFLEISLSFSTSKL